MAATGTGNGDERLQEISNTHSGTVLSKFDYTYSPVGTIATWQQQQDTNPPTVYGLGYDAADQLTSAVQTNTSTNATVSSNAYHYDPAGNRLVEVTATNTAAGQFNTLNQLTGLGTTTSSQTIAGNTSAPVSTVTVNAVPATVSNQTNFSANVPLPGGTNTVSVVATPSTGNVTTQRYQVVTTGSTPTTLTYDADGNTLTDESGNSYQWDALSRLAKITYSSGASSLFGYDGLSRRIQIVEKNSSGTITSTKNELWIGQEMAEEGDTSNTVTKRFFPQGEQQAGTVYYYTRDHLGSTREMLNSSGTIVARYGYDMYGKTILVSGSDLATFQYTGAYVHQPSGLNLTWFRVFDPNTGRWLSRDPEGEGADATLSSYVWNNPICFYDPLGLDGAVYPGGHHYLPGPVRDQLTPDVQDFADHLTTGPLSDPATNLYDKAHRDYSKAVKKLFDDYLKDNGKNANQCTNGDVGKLYQQISKSTDPAIKDFLDKMNGAGNRPINDPIIKNFIRMQETAETILESPSTSAGRAARATAAAGEE